MDALSLPGFILCACVPSDQRQHPRECFPVVGVYKGAAAVYAPELHPARTAVRRYGSPAPLEVAAGLLQVSSSSRTVHTELLQMKFRYSRL